MRKNRETKANKEARLIKWVTAIILIVVTFNVLIAHITYYSSKVTKDVNITIQNEAKRVEDESKISTIQQDIVQFSANYLLDYCSYYVQKRGAKADTLNALDAQIPVNLYYAFTNDNDVRPRILKTKLSDDFVLNTENLNILLKESYFDTVDSDDDHVFYRAQKAGDGYVIISYMDIDFEDAGFKLIAPFSPRNGEILFWLDDEDNVVSCNVSEYIGKKSSEIFYYNEDEHKGIGQLNNALGYYDTTSFDGNTIIVYVPLRIFINDILRGALAPIILFWVVIITILTYIFKINRDEVRTNVARRRVRIGSKLTVDGQIVSHISSLAIFGIILIGASIFYLCALISYSDQNVKAGNSLRSLSSAYEINQYNKEHMQKNIENEFTRYAKIASWGFVNSPSQITDTDLNTMVNTVSIFKSIKVTDGTGTIIASTTNDDGYTLGRNENVINSLCWQIMDGVRDEASYVKGSSINGGFDVSILVRRQDAKGVMIIDIAVDYVPDLLNIWDIEETMLMSDLGDATTLAVFQDDIDRVYISSPDAKRVSYLDTELNEKILGNGYNGIQTIKGIKYYINTLLNSEYDVVFMSALPIKNIPYAIAWRSLLVILFGMIVFVAFVIFVSARIEDIESKAEDEESSTRARGGNIGHEFKNFVIESDNTLNDEFKNVINRMILATGILLVCLLAADYIFQQQPLISYLLGSQWNRGFNLFSLTMILIVIVTCSIAGLIVNKITSMILNNMGPRGMTIGHLVGSLIRFILLIVAIILSLKELGANLSALLAGAGIAGAAISFCASSTIGDLLSGFFIVFEGSFQIGDWIKVGDWRGQVQSIGMRTTKIAFGDCVKIINNSAMTNVTVMDSVNSGALASIDIAYKEDIDKVIKLINDNRKLFMDEIPEMEDGPYVKGVTNLGANGITIELYAFGSQSDVGKIERGIRLTAKKLFDANNIEIPFNQVTIHHAKDE